MVIGDECREGTGNGDAEHEDTVIGTIKGLVKLFH